MDREVEKNSASIKKRKLDTTKRLPIITFTAENLNPGTQSWKSTCKSVREAMEEFSSFIAVVDGGELGLSPELMGSVFTSLKELFDLPTETKSLNTSELPGFGYFGGMGYQLIETVGIGDSTSLEAVQSLTKLMWPTGHDDFCKTIHHYAIEVSKLGEMVTRMIFESYGVEEYCDAFLDSSSYLLRLNSYKVPKVKETNVGVSAHGDSSFITIIKEDEVGGLEVQYSKDGAWIPVDFPPSSFTILAGDALFAWSNGKIRSCFHRVMMAKKARLSTALFSFNKGIVQVPEELAADGDGLLRFRSFDHFGLLKFRYINGFLSSEKRVKLFCGIQTDN